MILDILQNRFDELQIIQEQCKHKGLKTLLNKTMILNYELLKRAKENAKKGFDTEITADNVRYREIGSND